ncbi:Dihydrofolate reductase [compost metagenome]
MDEVFVIGGGSLINEMIGRADTIYRTMVLNTPLKGDVVRVLMPEHDHPSWDDYKCTETAYVENRLVFNTFELNHQG